MKKLGLVGGTGPESTVMYYRGIIEGVSAIEGAEVLPRLSIESLSVFDVFRFCNAQDFEGLADYFAEAIECLVASGAEIASLTANTPHIIFDELVERSPIPLVSVVEATRDVAVERGLAKVGLLGTEFTMVNDFFRKPFEEAGIEVVIPEADDVAFIQDKIATELEFGVVKEETARRFVEIIEDLVTREKIEQVILGCTELPLILNDDVSPVPCLDTTEVHIRALVSAVTEG